MRMLKQFFTENFRVISITFQIFWIIIFLLNRYTAASQGGGVPQFVYVNF